MFGEKIYIDTAIEYFTPCSALHARGNNMRGSWVTLYEAAVSSLENGSEGEVLMMKTTFEKQVKKLPAPFKVDLRHRGPPCSWEFKNYSRWAIRGTHQDDQCACVHPVTKEQLYRNPPSLPLPSLPPSLLSSPPLLPPSSPLSSLSPPRRG